MSLKLTNDATSTLAGSIVAGDTSLSIQPGAAGKFPALGAGDWCPATLIDAALNTEIVRVTARVGAVLTVIRAQEGTTAKDFAAGTSISLRITAETITAIRRLAATNINCSANPDYPAANNGEIYRVSVAGKIGGAAGLAVVVDDLMMCVADDTASGDHATVGASWMRFGAMVTTEKLAPNAVALDKLAQMAGGTVIGKPVGAPTGNSEYLTAAQLRAIVSTAVPVGAIVEYGGAVEPAGWVFAYGQNLSRTIYAALFTAYGTVHGPGDGATTFTLPDHRGRVTAGKDNMGGTSANRLTGLTGGVNGDVLGAAGGAESNVLTLAQLPSHGHTGTTGTESADHSHATYAGAYRGLNGSGNRGWSSGDSQDGSANLSSGGRSAAHTHSFTSNNAGSDAAHNNVQPTIVENMIIFTGVF